MDTFRFSEFMDHFLCKIICVFLFETANFRQDLISGRRRQNNSRRVCLQSEQ